MSKKNRMVKRDIKALRRETINTLLNKYYNIYMDNFEIEGLEAEPIDYVLRNFWALGTLAAFKIKIADEVGFTTYAATRWNMYDFPEECNLINKRNVPFIPKGSQVVNKDVVIGWIQSNHKPVKMIVDFYVKRIAEVEMVINTNLQLSKMPFLVAVSPSDQAKAEDIIDRILDDEVAVFTSLEELSLVQALATNTPYIIDKLYAYKTSVENELLTYLGIDNADENSRLLLDQVNANNQVINTNREGFLYHLETFFDKCNKLFGSHITVKTRAEQVQSVYTQANKGVNGGSEDAAEGSANNGGSNE